MFSAVHGLHRAASILPVGRVSCRHIILEVRHRAFSAQNTPKEAAYIEKYKDIMTIGANPIVAKFNDNSIRIGVSFCALNQYDFQYMMGRASPKLPFVPGSEFSGIVLEVGKGCTRGFKVGDKVLALPVRKYKGGGLAVECIVRETECHPIGSLSLEEAAALPLSHGAAHFTFSRLCKVQENEEIIVFTGIGGDGLAAIEIASKVYKATVHAVCDTDNIRALLREDGDIAYRIINGKGAMTQVYKTLDKAFVDKRVKTVFDGLNFGMIHVACDFIDSTGQFLTTDPLYKPEYIGAAKPDFKKVTNRARKNNQIELNSSYDHLIAQTKYVDFANYQLQDPDLFAKVLNEVFDMHAKRVIQPYISKIFSFQDVNKAFKFIQGRKCLGKVLIDVGSKNIS